MTDLQSVSSLSPKRLDLISLDDDRVDAKPRSTFQQFTRRLTTTFSRVTHDDGLKPPIHTEESMRQLKMRIIAKNPAIYQMFREGLVNKCYTHYTASYYLHYFLDNVLRVPELTDELITHPILVNNRPRPIGLFTYLLSGETTSPSSEKKCKELLSAGTKTCPGPFNEVDKAVLQSPPSIPSLDDALQNCSLSIPSLDSTGSHSDDDDTDMEDVQSTGSYSSLSHTS